MSLSIFMDVDDLLRTNRKEGDDTWFISQTFLRNFEVYDTGVNIFGNQSPPISSLYGYV